MKPDIRRSDQVSSWQEVDLSTESEISKRQAAGHSSEGFFLIRFFEAGRLTLTCGWRLLVAALIKEPRRDKISFCLHSIKVVSAALPIPALIPEPMSSGWDNQPLDSATTQFSASPIWISYCRLPRIQHVIQSNKSLLTIHSFCLFCSPWEPEALKTVSNTA